MLNFTDSEIMNLLTRAKEQRIQVIYFKFHSCNPFVHWPCIVWRGHSLPRMSCIAWLASHGRLSTKDRMSRMNPVQNGLSVLCINHPDTWEHLSFECNSSSKILKSLMQLMDFDFVTQSIMTWQHYTVKSQETSSLQARVAMFCAVIYTIWEAGNDVLFKHQDPSSDNHCFTVSNELKVRWKHLLVGKNKNTKAVGLIFNIFWCLLFFWVCTRGMPLFWL